MAARPVAPLPRKAVGIDEQVRAAYWQPSPHEYDPQKPEPIGARILGKFSESQVPSALDHQAKEKAFVPGPGSYQTHEAKDFALPDGGRLNRIPPQDKLKIDEYPKPAPGAYGVPQDPSAPRHIYGAFGKDPRVSKFIQDEVRRSRDVPAPGEHEVLESMENVRPFCPEGGRIMDQTGRGQGYFADAAKLTRHNPDPGRYDLPSAIRPNKSSGTLVWKYQSETMAKTKQILKKVVGDGHENPDPGHYSLPDPEPAPVPFIKGRDTAPAMPHPFAYNCAPDHGRKFLAPLLERNSGDEIYGRAPSRESNASNGKGRPGRAKANADEVAEAQLPVNLKERDIEVAGGESAQWKMGGFASVKRSRSSPVIEQSDHPALALTKQKYTPLSRFYGRSDKTFTPMAPKRIETVKMHKNSIENQTLQRRKWAVGAIKSQIAAVTNVALEKLDEHKLRKQAMVGLMDKARFRMRMEGLAPDQQDAVIAEFPGVVEENISIAPSPLDSDYESGGMEAAEELFANLPREPLSTQMKLGRMADDTLDGGGHS